MKYFALIGLLFLFSCAGSPWINVDKSIKIIVKGEPCPIEQCGRIWPIWIDIKYTTKSELDTDLEGDQDIKPQATIPFLGF